MLEAALAGLFGLLIGSFLNVCIYRLPRDLSVVRPRSYCPQCEKPIAWFDNIPLVSYLMLGRRCRHCRQPIPVRYPIVEALTAVLFFVFVAALGPKLAALKFCLFAALLVGMIFSDFEELILPDEFTLGGCKAVGLVKEDVRKLAHGLCRLRAKGETTADAGQSFGKCDVCHLLLLFCHRVYERIGG